MKFNSLIGNKYHKLEALAENSTSCLCRCERGSLTEVSRINLRSGHTLNGKEATISEWSEMTNISPGTIWYRLSAWCGIEDALFKPTKHSRSKSTGERGDYL